MSNLSYQKGLKGEELAVEYLSKQGYMVLARRYKTLYGEIDIIAQKDKTIIFFEVKYRPNSPKGSGVESIKKLKKQRVITSINEYIAKEQLHKNKIRIDVIEISCDGVWHIENAFF